MQASPLPAGLVPGVLVLAALLAPPCAGQDERPAGPGEWGFHPEAGEVLRRSPPPFSWRPQGRGLRYELQASRDPGFERVDYHASGLRWNVHCPPVAFEPGEWTWRFRIDADGAEWSSARRFTLPVDARVFVLPPREELLPRIPDEHPRLFLRPEDLPRLREQARGPLAERFGELERACDALLEDPPPTAEPPLYDEDMVRGSDPWRERWWGNRRTTIAVLEGAATLGFTWLVGGREEHGQLGRRLLMEASRWDPEGSTGYRTNDEAGMPYAYHFSRAYTFLHPLLSEAERERCREVMAVRGAQMFAHLAPGHLWRPYSSHSNRAWHFLGEVGIAFHREIPAADDWVDFATQVFANVYPVWSDADGGWHEGAAYWRSYLGRFLWWADVQRSALGLDAYALPFFANAGDFVLYQCPPGTQGGGFGDLCARQTSAGFRELMTVLAAQSGDPHWQAWVEAVGGPAPEPGYIGLLRSVLPAVEPRPLEELPTSRLFRGTGKAVLGTRLVDARDNVQVTFKSSPFGSQSHGYEAQNAFLLNAFGERLLIRSGIRDSYGSEHHRGWMWQTKSVNSITVDGQGQVPHSAGARGEISAFHTEPGLHYVEGEAAQAYGGRLERFTRGILLVEPDLIVIHDRLRAPEPATFEWRLHARTPFELDGPTALVRGEAGACRVSFLEPGQLELTQTDRFDPPPRERIRLVEHHLTARASAAREVTFLTVIRTFAAETEPPPRALLERQGAGYRLETEAGGTCVTVTVDEHGELSCGRLRASTEPTTLAVFTASSARL